MQESVPWCLELPREMLWADKPCCLELPREMLWADVSWGISYLLLWREISDKNNWHEQWVIFAHGFRNISFHHSREDTIPKIIVSSKWRTWSGGSHRMKAKSTCRHQNPFLVTYFHHVGPPLKGSMAFNIVPQDGDKTFKIKASEGLFRIVA